MLGGLAGSGPTLLSGIQSEADLHCHLPIRKLVILEVAAHLGDLKPVHISDRLASSRDRVVDCVFTAWKKHLRAGAQQPAWISLEPPSRS